MTLTVAYILAVLLRYCFEHVAAIRDEGGLGTKDLGPDKSQIEPNDETNTPPLQGTDVRVEVSVAAPALASASLKVEGKYVVFYHKACQKYWGRGLPIILALEHAGANYECKGVEEAPDGTGFVAAPALQSPSGACIAQLPKIMMLLGDELGVAPKSPASNAKYGQLCLDAADLLSEVLGDKKDAERFNKWFGYLDKTLAKAGSGFFMAEGLTGVDFTMFLTFIYVESKGKSFDSFENLKKWLPKMKEDPAVKKLEATGIPFLPR